MEKLKLQNARLIELPVISEKERGSLAVVETGTHIPFTVKRAYYIFDVPSGAVRGVHAHKKQEQVFICVAGSVRVRLDDGKNKDEIVLHPGQALYLGPMIWDELCDFAPGTVVLVLAPEIYEKSDYIKNYDDFIHGF